MTEIFAHRGASVEVPENTIASFKRAIELCADGIELDIHMLCDGSIVVHHDAVLGRCETAEGSIYNHTKETIGDFSVGEKFSPDFITETTPFLRDVLELIKPSNLKLNVEIKQGIGFITNVASEVVRILDEFKMTSRCIISSFNHRLLAEIKEKDPRYKVGILCDSFYGYDVIEYCKHYGFDAIHPNYNVIDRDFIEACHKKSLEVNVWTVDNENDIRRMYEFGVDDIITNNVAIANRVLK